MSGARSRPRRVSPGDLVAVIAPGGPVSEPALADGLRLLAGRYTLRVGPWRGRPASGFLADGDDERRTELLAALVDPEVRAIVCARGGYGATRLLGDLDPARIAADPKPLVGFSDVTALHAAWLRAGLVSVHGPVVTQLGRLHDPQAAADDLIARLESPSAPPRWNDLEAVVPGRATGRAVGGNLEVFSRLLGTPWLPPLDGAVLFVEDVGERPYRLDRALVHLRLAGALDRLAAAVLGDFTGCDALDGPVPILGADVAAAQLARLGIPVLARAPFGHGRVNRAFVHGGRVTVDAGAGVVEFEEGAVA